MDSFCKVKDGFNVMMVEEYEKYEREANKLN